MAFGNLIMLIDNQVILTDAARPFVWRIEASTIQYKA